MLDMQWTHKMRQLHVSNNFLFCQHKAQRKRLELETRTKAAALLTVADLHLGSKFNYVLKLLNPIPCPTYETIVRIQINKAL